MIPGWAAVTDRVLTSLLVIMCKSWVSLAFWLFAMTSVSWSASTAHAQWREPRSETVFFELGAGLSGQVQGAYMKRVGYHPGMVGGVGAAVALTVGTMFPSSRSGPDFGLLLRWERLEKIEHDLLSDPEQPIQNWTTSAASF